MLCSMRTERIEQDSWRAVFLVVAIHHNLMYRCLTSQCSVGVIQHQIDFRLGEM